MYFVKQSLTGRRYQVELGNEQYAFPRESVGTREILLIFLVSGFARTNSERLPFTFVLQAMLNAVAIMQFVETFRLDK